MYGFGDFKNAYGIEETYGLVAGRHGIFSQHASSAQYSIEVVMNVEAYTAKAAYLTINQFSIPSGRWIDDEQLSNFQDLADRVYEMVSRRFPVVNEYQSGESQSYYIDFKPQNGVVAQIRMRVSLHEMNGGSEFIKPEFALKSFTVAGTDYASVGAAIGAIEKFCSEIARGDCSAWD